MQIHFLGANRQVTGSRYLIEAGGLRVMVDCGLFQERAFSGRNWEDPPVPPGEIDYLMLTHAHLDHCGLIPRLVAQGFDRPIVTVEPSVDLAKIIMVDAGHIQEEDAAYKKRRHQKEGRRGRYPEKPLYTAKQAEQVATLLRPVRYGQAMELNKHVTVTFHDAGHILGSALLEVAVTESGQMRRIVFSGDLGQWGNPLIHDPSVIERADYVVMESTYGDRNHKQRGPVGDQLARVIGATVERGGNVVIPTFALERAQELLYHLGQLIDAGRIVETRVYLDSPMAVNVTEVFHQYCRYLKPEIRCQFDSGAAALRFPGLNLVRRVKDSIAINRVGGSNIIMSSAGMCTGGRIKHHLRQNITRPESTILFVGYQAEGTLGRQIVDGHREVRIHGRMWPVRAAIEQIDGLSAHADRDDLLQWLSALKQPPRQLFLTHGEEQAALSLAKAIREKWGWQVSVPEYRQTHELN